MAHAAMMIFDVPSWPKELKLVSQFGRGEFQYLLVSFSEVLKNGGCDTSQVSAEWYRIQLTVHHNYKEMPFYELSKQMYTKQENKRQFANILHLIEIMLAIPISTAGVECSFSTMNRVKTDKCSCLNEEILDDLMCISIDGPAVETFDPKASMVLWKSVDGVKRR